MIALACILLSAQAATVDADALWSTGRRLESIATMTRSLAARPSDDGLRRKLAEREMTVHRYASALGHLQPLGAQAREPRARALFLLGEFERASELFDPEAEAELLPLIESLTRLGRQAEADALLPTAARAFGENDPRVMVLEGRRLARAGDLAGAALLFERVVEDDPWNAEALFGLGNALVRAGERERGLATLARHRALLPLLDERDFAARGLDMAPTHAPNHAQLGDAERALGRLEQAQAAYRRAMELATADQLSPIALRYARFLSEDRRDLEAALSLLREAARAAPDARLFVRLGDVLVEAGRPAEAIGAYESGLQWRPGDAAIRERIDSARRAQAAPGEGNERE